MNYIIPCINSNTQVIHIQTALTHKNISLWFLLLNETSLQFWTEGQISSQGLHCMYTF